MAFIYIVGSLRNPMVPKIGNLLRAKGHEAFDDWYSAGPEADDKWQEYERIRGRTYKDALYGEHALDVFAFDKRNLDKSDAGILVMPAGKSGHLELGYLIGKGRKGYVLFDKEPDRYDIMYNFAAEVFFDINELMKEF